MICRIYTETDELVMEATCGIRRDGDVELIPVRARRSLRAGEGPLLVAAGSSHYPARVTGVHRPPAASQVDGGAVYHLTPLVPA